MGDVLSQSFPGLVSGGYQVTSPPTKVYNCIAWAAGDATDWWWPEGDPEDGFWPEGLPRVLELAVFQALFTLLGYEACADDLAEPGYEKVAIFASADGLPTHAARQLSSGHWTSKIGELEDITHALHDIAGANYGNVALIMKRPLTDHNAAPRADLNG